MSGLGIFAASFGGTLERSFRERVLYSSGSDLRLLNVAQKQQRRHQAFCRGLRASGWRGASEPGPPQIRH